jgi:hypothetical protein
MARSRSFRCLTVPDVFCGLQFQDIQAFVSLATSEWPAVTISDATNAAGNTVCTHLPAAAVCCFQLVLAGWGYPSTASVSASHVAVLGRAPPGTTARTSAATPPRARPPTRGPARGAPPRPTARPSALAPLAPSARAKPSGSFCSSRLGLRFAVHSWSRSIVSI